MRLVGRNVLGEFGRWHPDAKSSLNAWTQIVVVNDFKHLADLRKTFGSADLVKPYTVFNIAGNKYRLIAIVDYELRAVKVVGLLTHAEYDRGRWRE